MWEQWGAVELDHSLAEDSDKGLSKSITTYLDAPN